MARPRPRILVLALSVAFPPRTQAQALSDTSARIRGAAISDFNGRPIAGVMISARAVKKFVVTDSDGQFALTGLPARKPAVPVSYGVREPQDYLFSLQAQATKQIAVVRHLAA